MGIEIGNEDNREPASSAPFPPKAKPDTPAAGPHDTPALTNPDATPGSGMLPTQEKTDNDADGATG